MIENRELTCIQCPLGCALRVSVDGGKVTVEGNGCPRGAVYAEREVTHPTRTVTSTVVVEGGALPRVSVKTAQEIPKEKIFEVMNDIRGLTVSAPVNIGDVLIENAAHCGVAVIATKSVEKIKK